MFQFKDRMIFLIFIGNNMMGDHLFSRILKVCLLLFGVCILSISSHESKEQMDYLKEKWQYWLTTHDVNHDGVLSRADVDLTLQNFPIVEELSSNEGKVADNNLEQYWMTYILYESDNTGTAELANRFADEYKNSKQAFIDRMTSLVQFILPVVDVDHADGLTLQRFIKVFQTFGHDKFTDETLQKAFNMFKPKNGVIPLKQYEDDWVKFFTSDDTSKPDVVLEIYEAGYL